MQVVLRVCVQTLPALSSTMASPLFDLSSPWLWLALAALVYYFFFSASTPKSVDLKTLLPGTLSSRGVPVETAAALAGARYVVLYCSAHWCPPCRAFTPVLSQFFSAHAARLGAAFIFVSLDRDSAAAAEYGASMSWPLAVPFADAGAVRAALAVSGIPCLIIVDAASGKVLTTQGVAGVYGDSAGLRFPWAA